MGLQNPAPPRRSNCLAAGSRVIAFVFFSIQKMSYVAELFRGVLERLNLLSQLRLFGLLLTEHFMDISHDAALLSGTLSTCLHPVNRRG